MKKSRFTDGQIIAALKQARGIDTVIRAPEIVTDRQRNHRTPEGVAEATEGSGQRPGGKHAQQPEHTGLS